MSRRRATDIVLGGSFPVFLIGIWWLTAAFGVLPEQILPAPSLVWQSFLDQISDGSLANHTLVSLKRVAVGYGLGMALGLSFGMAVGLSTFVRATIAPVVEAAAQINAMAWLPLLVLFLGIDELLKAVVIAWSASISIGLGTARGILNVSERYRELGRVLVLSRRDELTMIILPAALPSVFVGLREGLANAWQTLVIVELYASFEGLGFVMTWGRQLFQLELVLVAMVVVAVIGFALGSTLKQIEHRISPWAAEAGR